MSESINTLRDYSEDMYRFFFEVIDTSGAVKQMISNFLGEENTKSLIGVACGYEFDMPIQCAPDLIRLLARENIGIYQVVRGPRAAGVWRSKQTISDVVNLPGSGNKFELQSPHDRPDRPDPPLAPDLIPPA